MEKRLQAYLEFKERLWRPSTYRSTRIRLMRAVKLVPDLDPSKLWEIYTAENLSRYTIKINLIALARFEKEALQKRVIQDWLKENAFLFRNAYQTKTTLVTEEQFYDILNKVKSKLGLYNLLVLMGEAGLRRQEALKARWEDIKDNVITVEGKGGKTRRIPIDQSKLRRSEELSQTIVGSCKGIHYFLRSSPFTFHDLRAFYATRLVNTPGISLKDAQLLLGHSSILTTERYLRSDFERVKRILTEVNA